MNFNRTILAGNLTKDPELRYLPTGAAVCQFGIAVNRKWKGADEKENEEVFFGECQAWGKTAETIAQYFKKGNPIFVEGRLKTEQWDDKTTGKKVSATRIIVDTFQFVGAKADGASKAVRNAVESVGKDKPAELPPGVSAGSDSDVPFN